MRNYRFVDLSQPLYNGIPLASVLPRFVLWPCLEKRVGDSVNSNAALISDHTGTHCDAPRHMFDDGKSVDQFPIDAYSGPAVCLDVRHRDGMAITADDVKEAEAQAFREIQAGDVVLLATNHSRLWRETPEGYEYLKNRPWIDPSAAEYFVEKGIKAIGIDVGGPDPLGGTHIIHEMLLSRDILITESLCNLEQLIGKDFYFLAFPLKFTGSSGAPTRAVAMLEE